MKHGMLEMQRLLRLVQERDPECARLCALAIEHAANEFPGLTILQLLYRIYEALPGITLSEKEKELLKVQIPI